LQLTHATNSEGSISIPVPPRHWKRHPPPNQHHAQQLTRPLPGPRHHRRRTRPSTPPPRPANMPNSGPRQGFPCGLPIARRAASKPRPSRATTPGGWRLNLQTLAEENVGSIRTCAVVLRSFAALCCYDQFSQTTKSCVPHANRGISRYYAPGRCIRCERRAGRMYSPLMHKRNITDNTPHETLPNTR